MKSATMMIANLLQDFSSITVFTQEETRARAFEKITKDYECTLAFINNRETSEKGLDEIITGVGTRHFLQIVLQEILS